MAENDEKQPGKGVSEVKQAHTRSPATSGAPEVPEKVRTDPTRVTVSICGFSINTGYLSLLVLVVQNAALVLLTRYSRSQQKGELYRSSSLILNQELLKLAACLGYMLWENRKTTTRFADQLYHAVFCLETVQLGVPAVLFTFQNYLLFVSLSHLDAMTFQLLSQVKLLLAALFSVWILDRYLTCVQWTSVVVLTFGIVLASQVPGTEKVAPQIHQNVLLGAFSCVASGTSSAFASVYFEKILKGTPPSIAVRNVQLGIFSIILAVGSMLVIDGVPGRSFVYFGGYSALTWVLVLVHAGGGILVAVVVKYADNILKGFATGVAIIVSGLYAAVAWGFAPSLHFIVGACIVTAGTCVYNIPDPNVPAIQKLARMMPGGHRIPLPKQPVKELPV
ncbi:UDP-galactose/UDP-N-acetylglucosamine transporter srf-3 [Diplonema papillatum]|nr:UDP-galactose/UDP-N-acetylglucosamine transporter srf-3 [Diplonema papillatum]